VGKNSAQEILQEGEELGCTILELVFSNRYNSTEVPVMSASRPFPSPNQLTDDEFAFLDTFLRKANSGRAMNLEEMDGFFTALVCGPQMVLPSEYMPHVWGNETSEHGVFQSLEEAQEILNLLTRHWNTIAGTLHKGRVYFPFLFEDEKGNAQGNDWAKGFLRSMGMRRDSWNELLDDPQHGDSLVPVFMLAYEHDPDSKLRPKRISPEKREAILNHMAAGIAVAYEYFRPQRRGHATA
jgi:uncharacterized protein